MEYSVIIPVFNSEQSLPELTQRIISTFETITPVFEIIFVDDFSQDNSWNVLLNLKNENPNQIKLFRLGKNFGQHNATICGFHQAQGKWVVTMDDDLQQAPEDLPVLINKMQESGANIVYGIANENHPLYRKISSNAYKKSAKHLHGSFGNGSSFRLIEGSLIEKLKSHQQQFNFIDEVLHWYTNFIECVKVSHAPRKYGKSAYSPQKLWSLANNNTLNYSNWPAEINDVCWRYFFFYFHANRNLFYTEKSNF